MHATYIEDMQIQRAGRDSAGPPRYVGVYGMYVACMLIVADVLDV